MSEDRITSFAEFWPYYVREHSVPANRVLHFVGTTLAFAVLAYAVVTSTWSLLLFVPIAGYGFAWFGHFGIQKNRPATFKYPFWSLISDFRMWGMTLVGRMGAEVERAMAMRSK